MSVLFYSTLAAFTSAAESYVKHRTYSDDIRAGGKIGFSDAALPTLEFSLGFIVIV